MDIDDGRCRRQRHERAQALRHRVGNVVQLEIEKNRHAFIGDGTITLGAMGIEKFHAELHIADVAAQAIDEKAGAAKVRRIEGHANGIGAGHGAGASANSR